MEKIDRPASKSYAAVWNLFNLGFLESRIGAKREIGRRFRQKAMQATLRRYRARSTST